MHAARSRRKALTIIREPASRPDPQALALTALGWVVSDPQRAGRLLALTGLAPADLRAGVADPAVLAAVLDFLLANERDLVAAAAALEVDAAVLAGARTELGA